MLDSNCTACKDLFCSEQFLFIIIWFPVCYSFYYCTETMLPLIPLKFSDVEGKPLMHRSRFVVFLVPIFC